MYVNVVVLVSTEYCASTIDLLTTTETENPESEVEGSTTHMLWFRLFPLVTAFNSIRILSFAKVCISNVTHSLCDESNAPTVGIWVEENNIQTPLNMIIKARKEAMLLGLSEILNPLYVIIYQLILTRSARSQCHNCHKPD